MNNKNFRLQELKRWLKTSLKNKISINDKTVITYLMLGFAGFGMIAEAGWATSWGEVQYYTKNSYTEESADAFTFGWAAEKNKVGQGSVMITKGDQVNQKLMNSVVIGYGGGGATSDNNAESQKLKIEVEDGGHGIVAIGSVRVQSNPHSIGRTGNGGQAVAIGNDITSTSQAVAIGNNTYAIGGSSIAIGNDDIATYRDKVTNHDYKTYFKSLYDKIDPSRKTYGIGTAENAIYSPNVAAGEGSISIGSRSVAYNPGSTALGTLAYALGKGATALGTQSRAEGDGSIAIGNETRNFANQALAIGNDSQILNIGGTAVGLRAGAAGEGSIAIGTDVFANAAMNNTASTQAMTQIHETLKNRNMGVDKATIDGLESELIKSDSVSAERRQYHDINNIIRNYGETYKNDGTIDTKGTKNAIVIGTKSAAIGDNSMALGRGAFAMANNAFGIGSYSYADKENSLAIGTSARSLAAGAIVMGAGSVATNISKNATVIGTRSGVTGENSSVVGSNSEAFSKNTLIYGNETKVGELNSANNTDNNIAIGNNISIGSGVTNSMAYGSGTRIGYSNRAENSKIENSTAFGRNATVERVYTGTIAGEMSNTQAKQEADRNANFMYTGNNAMAIGNYSRAVLENSVALGVRSDTDYTYADLMQPGWTARGSIAVPTSGQTGVISVGSKGQERRIVNVASGFRDTDAVNVIQLRTLEETVTNKVEGIESGMHYLSVNKEGADYGGEKGSKNVSQLIEREKNFNQYVRYRIQQIQLEARQKWQGEKFNEDSLNEINKKVTELGTDSAITNVASELVRKTISPTVPDGKSAAQAYKDLVTELENIRYDLVEKDRTDLDKIDGKFQKGKYYELLAGEDIEALKKATNYSNEGGKGDDSLAIGFRASAGASATKALAVGYKSTANGAASIANGAESTASSENAIAVGYKAIASAKNTVAIGSGAKADLEYSVALGQGVTVGKSEGKSYATNRAFADTGKVVSVGGRRINQLEDGAQDTDAVTVRQLRAMPISLKADQGSTAGEAGKVVKTDPGATVGVVSGDFNTGGNRYVGENIETFISSGNTSNPTITIGIKENPNFKSVSINNGTNSVLLSTDSSGNLNVGTKKITGVANGTSTNDAVNYSQLTASSPSLKAENAGSGISNNTLKTNNGSTIELKSGDFNGANNVRFVGENLSTHIGGSADAPVITLGIKKEPKFKTVVLNNEASGASDLTLSSDNSGNLSVGNKKITNVADGDIAVNSKDAINGGQLHTVKTTADTANTTANTAKTTAEAAKTKAEDLATKLTALGDKKLGFTVNGGTKLEKKLGETIAIEGDNSSIVTEISSGKIVAKVKDSGITEGKLASNAVTTDKIKDGAVSSGKIAAKAIDDTKLTDTLKNKIDNANKVANNTISLKGDAETGTTLTTTNAVNLNNDGGISFTFEGKDGLKTKASGTKVEIGMDSALKTKLAKLNNLDENANAKYATKEELANKASTLNIGSGTTTETVNLKTDTLKVTGSGDVTVSLNNKEFTVGLSEEAKKKLDNVTAKSDGKDKKDSSKTENADSSGNKGLTKEDKLNGKDLTDKVNALRNGEAGTVVFTDAAGNRLVKANDGKYYLAKNVSDTGETKRADGDTSDPVAVDNPELRVVNSNGETTKVTTLNNIANAIQGLTNGTTPITAEKAKTAVEALLKQTDLNKAVNVGDLQAIAQAGLDFAGNTGEATHRALGTTLSIKGKADANYDDTYTSDNIATKVTEGNIEIGFKKSPTFEKVTAKEVDAEKAKVKGELTFDSGNGKPTTVVAGDGNGSLMINGKKVATSDSAPVLYTDADGNIVEKGLDGNIYKSEDLKGKRFDKTTNKYYAEDQFDSDTGTLKATAVETNITPVNKDTVKHALASIDNGAVTTPKVLSNVATGVKDNDAVNVKQLKDSYITFGGDAGTDKNIKLSEKLAIKGSDTISTEMTDTGLVIKVKEGKVDAPKIADQAVTSAKLAQDARTVVYVTSDNKPVELGADGKLHKSEDLKGKTYIVSKNPAITSGYYADSDLNSDKTAPLDSTKTPVTIEEVVSTTANPLRHALNGYIAGGTDVTTKSVLTNVGAGAIADNSTDAINGSQIKNVLDKMGVEIDSSTGKIKEPTITAIKGANGTDEATPTTLKDGLNKVISKVNEGLKYNGDLGTENTQQLGSKLTVNKAGSELTAQDAPTVKYVGNNLITKYTKDSDGNGKIEIGFKESPTFKDVTSDSLTTKTLTFDDGKGNKLKVGPTTDGTALKIGEKEIATKEDVILKLSKDGLADNGKVDLSSQKLHVAGSDGISVDIAANKIDVKLDATTKSKLDNLDANASTKYANKDASNLNDLTEDQKKAWKAAIGLENAVSGTGSLSIEAFTKGTAADATETSKGTATVKLDGIEKFKLLGTQGITVTGSTENGNKTLTFGLDEETVKKINKVGAPSEGRDGLDGSNGHNGANGLTAKDGLNGKDLTDKVNAIRNGEAGTVVFTDSEGNRLVKANDGNYYKAEKVDDKGNLKNESDKIKKAIDGKYYAADKVDATGNLTDQNAQPVDYDPELRVVNEDGSTILANKLSNIADGKINENSKDAINGSQIKKLLDKLGVETDPNTGEIKQPEITALNNSNGTPGTKPSTLKDGLNNVIAKVNEGIKYNGDLGDEGAQQLGTVFNVNKAENTLTKDDVNYVGNNIITKYTKDTNGNGKLEIGFKESPTFKNVKAENIEAIDGKFKDLKVTEKIVTKEIEFKDGTGNNLTLVSGKDGNLYINGVAVPSAANAPVIYTNTDGERVELGQDGNVYKPKDLEGLTYVKARAAEGTAGTPDYKPAITAGYYNNETMFKKNTEGVIEKDADGNKILVDNATPTNLTDKVYSGKVVHRLSPIKKGDTEARLLTNLANGEVSANSKDAINGAQLYELQEKPITFKGDTDADQVTRKLGETLNITGDGVKVSKNANGDGFVLSIDQGKVQTKNVADEAVTSAKLAKDARTVVYIDADGDPVELGADGKLHKAKDLKDKTYIESKDSAIPSGYYNNTDLNAERTKPNTGAQVVTVAETTPVKHALNGYTDDKLDTNTKSVLTNVGNGKIAADSTDAINGTQMKSVVDAIGATLDAEGKTITLPPITTVTGKVAPTNIVDGLNKSIEVINSGLNFAGDTGNGNQLLGSTLNVKTGDFDITKDDTTVNYKGTNIETKYEKGTDGNGTITVGITDKPKFKKVSTEELELIDSKNADNKATIKVDGDKVKVNDKEIATKDEVTSVTANSIKLTANGTTTTAGTTENNETDIQLLNKAGGLSFGILGSEGLITTANGNNITVKLDETTKAKLENITAVADGKDGLKGDTGNTGATGAMGEKGLTGNDGLNGKDLTTKVNALRDGEAGTVVFTDETGNRVVKAKDGKYYLAKNVSDTGEPIRATGETEDPVAVNNPQLRTVNSDGTTTTPVTLNNVASALGLDSTLAKAIEEAEAKNKVGTLLSEANKDNLNKVVTVRDLQALAQAGLDFTGNAGTVHRTLGSVLKIVGKEVTGFTADKFTENFSTENVATNVKEDGTVEIGISKKVKFEEVDGDKVKAKELVLKPQDETKADLKIKTDGEGNLVVGDKKITAGDITLSLTGKTIDSKNVETTTGNGENDKVNLSNGEKLEVIAKNGVTVEIQGKDITLGLDQSTQDKLKNITSVSDGKDGKDAKDPANGANGNHGLTANDGLNGKDLTAKVNALRNGEAGTVVFTDGEGHRLVKANDGNYYLVANVNENGTLKDGITEANKVENPELRVVNSNGETTKVTTLNNIANGLKGLTNADAAVTKEKAIEVVTTLLTQTDGLNKAVNVGDLQAIAQAGLNFTGNTGSVHSPLSTTLNIAGQGSPSADFVGASGNIKVEATQGTEDRISKLEIQLAEALKGIKSIQNEDTKITLDKDNGVAITGKDGGKVVVKDKDGNDKVTIKGGTDTESPSIEFAKKTDGDTTTGTGTITGLKDPEIDTTTNKPKDPTAATTVNYVTNQIEGAKTEITNKITNIVDGGMKYTGNDNVEVTVKLNKGLNIKGEGDYTGENSATGNIAVTGNNTTSTLEIKLNKNLKNIETISNGDTKITLAKDGISVSGKDGNSTVAINGGNGTNGASISVNGKDGKDGVTIKGGNGTDGATITFDKKTDGTGTGSITGLKDPEFNEDGTPKDPTAATTVNYVTNEIKNVTNTINNAVNKMDKGLNFVGNDGESVNAKLDGTVSITGEGTIATGTNTAANNIKVEKDSTEGKTGLVVKLADKLTGMTGFETKVEDGKKVTIDKDGITFNKDATGKGTGVITGLKDDEKDSTSAVTRGTYNTFVTEVTNKLNKVSTIKYSDSKGEHSVAPDTGFTFKGDGNITTVAKEDGVVEFNLNKHIDLSSKSELGTITGVKTKEDDATSVATVNYVESKMGDSVKVANKALVGVANAVAMANLPQVNNVGNNRHVISAAYGNYEGQNALALGISGVNKERTLIYKGSAALNTSGKVALGVGIGYQFGTDKHDEIKESETVKALKEEVIALKSKDDKNTTIISELKEEMKRKDIENEYKTHRLEEENKEIKSYIEELRKENEKTREALERLLEAFKAKEEK